MKKVLIIIALIIAGVLVWWLLSPLFINVEVQDELDLSIEAILENTEQTTTSDDQTNPEETTQITGPFIIQDTPRYPATGSVRVIQSPEETIVRYENYDGTNGPDLFVYLANDLEADDFVSLGRAKGNQGNINYTVPGDIDINDYKYVMTWCRLAGSLFDYAEINEQ